LECFAFWGPRFKSSPELFFNELIPSSNPPGIAARPVDGPSTQTPRPLPPSLSGFSLCYFRGSFPLQTPRMDAMSVFCRRISATPHSPLRSPPALPFLWREPTFPTKRNARPLRGNLSSFFKNNHLLPPGSPAPLPLGTS